MKAVRKVAANLSIRSDLVQEARALGLNLSELLESAVRDALRERHRQAWLEENHEAIGAYNAKVARDGVFSDRWRKF